MIVHNKLYYHTYNVLRNDLVVAPGVYPHRKMEGQLSQRTFRPPEQEKPVEAVDDKYKNIPKSRYRSFNLPSWYEDAPFQYNRRVLLGLIPGAILLGITEGANLFAAIAASVLVVLLVHQGGGYWYAVVLAIMSFFFVALVSVYSVAPLIWRSVLNYPLGIIAHMVLLIGGTWCLLLLKAFRLYDPSIVVILEQVVMGTLPIVVIFPVLWEHLMLFPAHFLPHSLTVAWFIGLGLFVVPLQSSFAKKNTPKDEALILNKYLALSHMVLFVAIPPMAEWFFSRHLNFIDSVLSMVLFLFLPSFLLTLLEAQGMMHWTGVPNHLIPYIRRTFGFVVLVCTSLLLYRNDQSEMLLLAFPMAIVQFLAITSSESEEDFVILPRQIVAAASILIAYMGAFLRLPWGLSYHFLGPLMLTLDAVQVILVAMAICSVVLFVFWKRTSSAAVWIAYLAAFSLCEHMLLVYNVYHPLMMLLTSVLGIALMHRLWAVRRIGRNCVWLCVCILLTKLTQLLLVKNVSPIETALAHAAVFLVSVATVKMGVYQITSTLKPSHLVFFTAVLSVGLLASVPTVLSPLWVATTHTLLPISVIVASSLLAVSLYVIYGMKFLKKAPPQWLSQLPMGIVVMAVILGVLQPELGMEIVQSVLILYVHYFMPESTVHGLDVPGGMVAAWTAVLEWCVILSLVSTTIAILQKSYRWLSTLCASFLGAFVGVLLAAWLLHHPPTSGFAIEYAVVCSLAATIICRAITANRAGSYLDSIMFALQLIVFVANLSSEMFNIDSIQEEETGTAMLDTVHGFLP
jgi:hypothetical protein